MRTGRMAVLPNLISFGQLGGLFVDARLEGERADEQQLATAPLDGF
jgi:hypothetical protein